MKPTVKLSPPDPLPAPRRSAAGGVFAGSLYVFGGVNDEHRHFSDIWKLSLSDETWTLLSKDELPRIRLPGVSRINGTFYLFGGRDGDETFSNQLWTYDDRGVRRLDVEEPMPEPRYGHSQVAIGTDMYVFGGYQYPNERHKLFGGLWRYDVEQGEWSQLSQGGPSPRYGAGMVGSQQQLVVFGGRYLDKEHWETNETWTFDIASREWTRIDHSQAPGPRYTPGIVGTEDAFYIYGGRKSVYKPFDTPFIRKLNRTLGRIPVRSSVKPTFKHNVYLSDLWRFDRTEQTWECLATDLDIATSKTPLMGVEGSSLIVGFGSCSTDHHADVWRIPDCL